ncbi:hypothetical protein WJX72_009003 [[Myrmecia] bisecta]|uniref:Peptidase S1 domain-containing protein n=1 Tax=[Myrmecia] bisecta TaxID=41462 RepID=A0AAW1R8V8_9CHLO
MFKHIVCISDGTAPGPSQGLIIYTCAGDSGSPLLERGRTVAEDKLRGVAAFGPDACQGKPKGLFSVFTDVADPQVQYFIESEINAADALSRFQGVDPNDPCPMG